MGFESRDYSRDGDSYTDRIAGWGLESIPPTTKRLVIVTVVVFVLQLLFTRPMTSDEVREKQQHFRKVIGPSTEKLRDADIEMLFEKRVSVVQRWCEFDTDKVLHGQIWRLLTYAFCHDRLSLMHLLINMLVFYWAGEALESSYGSREFLLFYLAAAIVSGLTFLAFDLLLPGVGAMVGASGAVMAALMLFAIHYPRHEIRLFFFFPLELRWVVLLYVAFDLFPVLAALGGTNLQTGVAHAAHLGGFAFGFLYWRYRWQLEPLWDRVAARIPQRIPRERTWDEPSRRRDPVHEEPADDLDELVDVILQKIHAQGEASLTDLERDTLKQASERYKRKWR